jgi:hypothetical protein
MDLLNEITRSNLWTRSDKIFSESHLCKWQRISQEVITLQQSPHLDRADIFRRQEELNNKAGDLIKKFLLNKSTPNKLIEPYKARLYLYLCLLEIRILNEGARNLALELPVPLLSPHQDSREINIMIPRLTAQQYLTYWDSPDAIRRAIETIQYFWPANPTPLLLKLAQDLRIQIPETIRPAQAALARASKSSRTTHGGSRANITQQTAAVAAAEVEAATAASGRSRPRSHTSSSSTSPRHCTLYATPPGEGAYTGDSDAILSKIAEYIHSKLPNKTSKKTPPKKHSKKTRKPSEHKSRVAAAITLYGMIMQGDLGEHFKPENIMTQIQIKFLDNKKLDLSDWLTYKGVLMEIQQALQEPRVLLNEIDTAAFAHSPTLYQILTNYDYGPNFRELIDTIIQLKSAMTMPLIATYS